MAVVATRGPSIKRARRFAVPKKVQPKQPETRTFGQKLSEIHEQLKYPREKYLLAGLMGGAAAVPLWLRVYRNPATRMAAGMGLWWAQREAITRIAEKYTKGVARFAQWRAGKHMAKRAAEAMKTQGWPPYDKPYWA